MSKSKKNINLEEVAGLKTKSDLFELLEEKGKNGKKIIKTIQYEQELITLQVELGKLQNWIKENGKRLAIIFEGRDAAGKGGTIRRFIEHLNPRQMRVVALSKPTEAEQGQWYFQRYIKQLPNAGEIVFFDRSWYNRAVVEPVNGFCTEKQYNRFMKQVNEFEHLLFEDGVKVIKFWLDTTKDEQKKRFDARRENPLKHWKISPIDEKAQSLWDDYTTYRDAMFEKTSPAFCPWVVVQADSKKIARLETIKYVLTNVPYQEETNEAFQPNSEIISKI